MTTPFETARPALAKAILRIEQPRLPDEEAIVPVRFNPTEYQVQKQNTFADINIPGLETPPIQFIRGSGEKLSTELLVDTSDTLEDVREKYVNRLRGLMNIQRELHAPPILSFFWDRTVFRGVLESLNIAYVMFRPDGVPIRARLSITLKEYKTVAEQLNEGPKNSPDVEKSYTVVRGDTLSRIAFQVFRDASRWRDIARANKIRDPRRLPPGLTLTIPKLT
jgi:nucleoid-associated protein YgaU